MIYVECDVVCGPLCFADFGASRSSFLAETYSGLCHEQEYLVRWKNQANRDQPNFPPRLNNDKMCACLRRVGHFVWCAPEMYGLVFCVRACICLLRLCDSSRNNGLSSMPVVFFCVTWDVAAAYRPSFARPAPCLHHVRLVGIMTHSEFTFYLW